MEIKVEDRNGVVVVGPIGRVDTNTAPEFEDIVRKQLESGVTRLVLDMAGVEYTSSAGLRVILWAAKKLKSGGKLTLCALTPGVEQVFDLAGFLDILDVKGTLDEALAALGPGGAG